MSIKVFDIKGRFEKLTRSNSIYSYLGQLPSEELNEVLAEIELILEEKVESRVLRKKLFQLLIEITQNLSNYNAGNHINNQLFFTVNAHNGGYTIITGNYLLSKEIAGLKSRIDMVNLMDKAELKALYRGILDFGGRSNNGGAGLGIVDLARRSGKKLKYKFEDVDDKISFFTLEVKASA
ncbi:MAG: SiaB family protein kinase [Fulvivirga sp.]|nr:SiaB family protein kinase [Fulvivirga sp.]